VWSQPVGLTFHLLQTFMNAHGVGQVALAGATSNLFAMLADSYRRSKRIQPGDEIIILDSSHEVRCFTALTSGSVLFRLTVHNVPG